MLRFNRFVRWLEEALEHGNVKLTGSGEDGARHVSKYIMPHLNATEPTHRMASAFGKAIPKDAEVNVRGVKKIDNKYHAVVEHEGQHHIVPISKFYKPRVSYSYNDEHATKNIWNHAVLHGVKDGGKLAEEIEKAKKDPSHPLAFEKAELDGFTGKKKTEGHRNSYYDELHTAAKTVGGLLKHPDFQESFKKKHLAKVMGGERGILSDRWVKHGAAQNSPAATSKSDVAIGEEGNEHKGLLLSMKKGGGSQLASSGPAEFAAMHEHAIEHMLADHPKYKNLNTAQKDEIHRNFMSDIHQVRAHMDAAKGKEKDNKRPHVTEANKILDRAHTNHPEINHYLRLEATSGEGKFGKGTKHAASHIVIGATDKDGAKIKRIQDVDHSGAKPFISLGKGGTSADPLTMRLPA